MIGFSNYLSNKKLFDIVTFFKVTPGITWIWTHFHGFKCVQVTFGVILSYIILLNILLLVASFNKIISIYFSCLQNFKIIN